MCNLYKRLVKKENDWTEALVDLLERLLSKGRFRGFFSEVQLANPTDEGEKRRFLDMLDNSLDALSIETQYRIPQGRIPDIVVFNGGCPICVVEVKIGAAIEVGQLEDYGAFLEDNANNNPTALVLLTHSTPAPDEFTNAACNNYRVSLRSVASWNNTAAWFEKLSHEGNGVDESLKDRTREFSEFLKGYTMPTLDDVAKTRLYLADSHDALTGSVKNMGAGFQFPNGWKDWKKNCDDSDIEHKPVGLCKWHKYEQDDQYTGYGICFKPVDKNDRYLRGFQRYENDNLNNPKPVKIEDGFYAFVCVGGPSGQWQKIPGYSENQWYECNKANELTPAKNGPHVDSTEWWYYNGAGEAYYAKIHPISELLDGDARIGNKLQKWTHKTLGDVLELWKALNP